MTYHYKGFMRPLYKSVNDSLNYVTFVKIESVHWLIQYQEFRVLDKGPCKKAQTLFSGR